MAYTVVDPSEISGGDKPVYTVVDPATIQRQKGFQKRIFGKPISTIAPPGPQVPKPMGISDRNESIEPWSTRQKVANEVRPYLQTGGMIAGGLLAGPETGFLASGAAAGGGYAAGGTLSDIISGDFQKRSIVQNIGEAAKQGVEGAAMEYGGKLLKPVFKGGKWVLEQVLKSAGDVTAKGAERKAGSLLLERTSENPIYQKNMAEASKLKAAIPGTSYTMGQMTNDPKKIMLERSQIRAGEKPGVVSAAEKNFDQRYQNKAAIQDYRSKQIPGKSEDFTKELQTNSSKVSGNKISLDQKARSEASKLKTTDSQATGNKILDAIEKEKAPVHEAMTKLEQAVPDYPMSFRETNARITEILQNKKISKQQEIAVKGFAKDMRSLLEKGETTHTAFGVNRTLNDAIQAADAKGQSSVAEILRKIKHGGIGKDLAEMSNLSRTGKIIDYNGQAINADKLATEFENNAKRIAKTETNGTPDVKKMVDTLNKEKIPALKQRGEGQDQFIQRIGKDYKRITKQEIPMNTVSNSKEIEALTGRNNEIKNILSKSSPGQDVGASMRAYNEYASKEYFGRFKSGALSQTTRQGTRLENIPNAFKTPSGADDLIKAMGSREKAADLIREDLNHDLLRHATGQNDEININKLKDWQKQNGAILKKYGMSGDYINLTKAQAMADKAAITAKEFEKSAASKILGADPEKMFDASLTGSNIGGKAKELYNLVKHSPTAKAGLQASFSDHLTSVLNVTSDEIEKQGLKTADKINKTFTKYIPAMREIYKDDPKKLSALMNINKAINTMARNVASPIGGGSDTRENFAAQLFSHLAPHGMPTRLLSTLFEPLRTRGERMTTNYITKAIFDPEYAQTLIDAAKGRLTPNKFSGIIEKQLERIGTVAPKIAAFGKGINEKQRQDKKWKTIGGEDE